jgi:hypothetical protein
VQCVEVQAERGDDLVDGVDRVGSHFDSRGLYSARGGFSVTL